jgi:hypothetical protein
MYRRWRLLAVWIMCNGMGYVSENFGRMYYVMMYVMVFFI